MDRGRECAICGRRRPLDAHAPGLEVNFPGFRVWVCKRCHNGPKGLTSRQFDTGMLRDHTARGPRSPLSAAERNYAFARGAVDVLAASARASEDPRIRDAARVLERIGTAAARLSSFDAVPGKVVGPQPAKNRRRWRKSGGPALGRGRTVEPAAQLECFEAILAFVADWTQVAAENLAAIAPESPLTAAQRRTAEDMAKAAAGIDHLLVGLLKLEAAGSLDDLAGAVEACVDGLEKSTSVVIELPGPEAPLDEEAVTNLRFQAIVERAFTTLLRELAEGDPVDALGRFVRTIGEASR